MNGTAAIDLSIQRAVRNIERGDSRLALTELDGLATREPGAIELAEWWHLRILAFAEMDELDSALEGLHRAISRWPDDVELWLTGARVLAASGRLAAAEDAARFVLSEIPDDPRALSVYATTLSRGGEHRAARALAERALSIAPSEPAVLRARLDVAVASGEQERDIDGHLARILAADPEDVEALHIRSQEEMKRGRFRSARGSSDEAARITPGLESVTERSRELRRLDHWSMWPIRLMHRGRAWAAVPWIAAFVLGRLAGGTLGGLVAVGILLAYARFWPQLRERIATR